MAASETKIVAFIILQGADGSDAPDVILKYLCGEKRSDTEIIKLPLSRLPKTFISVFDTEHYDNKALYGLRNQFGYRFGFILFFKTNDPKYQKSGRDILRKIGVSAVNILVRSGSPDTFDSYLGSGGFYNNGEILIKWDGKNFSLPEIIPDLKEYPEWEFLLKIWQGKITVKTSDYVEGYDILKLYLENGGKLPGEENFAHFIFYDDEMAIKIASSSPGRRSLVSEISMIPNLNYKDEYKESVDPIDVFIREKTSLYGRVSASILLMSFNEFCLINHLRTPMNKNDFSYEIIDKRGFSKKRFSKGIFYNLTLN